MVELLRSAAADGGLNVAKGLSSCQVSFPAHPAVPVSYHTLQQNLSKSAASGQLSTLVPCDARGGSKG